MGWFSKKKLPEDGNYEKGFGEINKINGNNQMQTTPALPAMPKTDFGDSISREAIKSIVSQPERGQQQNITKQSFPPQLNYTPQRPFHSPYVLSPSQEAASPAKEDKPIFIKIDKFKSAAENFRAIKEKVAEIESILKEIRASKVEEELELSGWENEINLIKSRMDNIDNSIFSRLDK